MSQRHPQGWPRQLLRFGRSRSFPRTSCWRSVLCISSYQQYSSCYLSQEVGQVMPPDCYCKDSNYVKQYAACVDRSCWTEEDIKDNFGLTVPVILNNECKKYGVTLDPNLFVGLKSGGGAVYTSIDTRTASPTALTNSTATASGFPDFTKDNRSGDEGSSNLPAIIGGSVGGAVLLLIATIVGFLLFRRRSRNKQGAHVPMTTHYPNASSLAPTAIASFSPNSQQTETKSHPGNYYAPHPDGYVSPDQWQQGMYAPYSNGSPAPPTQLSELSGQQVRVPSPANGVQPVNGWNSGNAGLAPLAELGDSSERSK
ncbi:hypothetical protein EX30DRAFT_120685 [Ascodesmis nigricans]|uniref:Extracellular membrane protein CFEM domain-containing protein n=1 Tax=Ascodesmis nigricans TaxID=341454 RepID=A0A4S2MPF8_9PEZI|nr:hypothetical protein EX30DRAFT_120685 [Ascodesmis nigricans]